jgi:ATP-dependent DNA helicase RecG
MVLKMLKQENQNTEFKESWRDEYIKWICGFANAEGGTLFIGVDDSGSVVGAENTNKLLEEIPNKVRDILGIIVDVNLHQFEGLDYLEIITQAYPSPINYKGQYHYRTGSTKQELKGHALDRFLLRKYGQTWDAVPHPYVTVDDLDKDTFEFFIKKAIDSKRLEPKDIPPNYQELLEKLRLTEGNYLRRSAVLLFHKKPQRFFTGCYVKIGYFESESTILYQDVIEGNLFHQVEKTMDLLLTKYMKALISYEGISRIERYDYDTDALREIIHNAIIHNDYSRKTPIQIRVYHDKIRISNVGSLPDNWTVETLLKEHRSEPFNPDLASAFFRAGYIESWGRGINTVMELSKAYNGTVPKFEFLGGMTVEFQANYPNKLADKVGNKVGNIVGKHLTDNQIEILENIRVDSKVSAKKLSVIVGISTRKIEENIAKLKDMGLLHRVGGTRGYWEIIDEK